MAAKVDARDLLKLERAMRRFAVRLPDAGDEVLEDTAEMMERDSSRAVATRPGSRGSYHREPGAYGTAVRNGAHAVTIERGGTAVAAEYGANYHHVFGRRVLAKSMKRRVFGGRVKRWRSGKVVGKLVKADIPHAEKRLAIAFDKAAEAEFTKLGL